MNIGENIRRIRKSKGLTMKELGKCIGISEQGIGNYERGDRKPDFVVLDEIANALGCRLLDLVGTENQDNQKVDSQSYFIEQYIRSLDYDIIYDIAEGNVTLQTKEGAFEITENDIAELKDSSKSFIEYKLHEIMKHSRKIK